jgi:hypothetical protein
VIDVDALHCGEPVHQLPLADGARAAVGSGQRDALVKAHQMRRGVDVHLEARRLQHRLQERRHRPLAVGARHMDHGRQPALGMAELAQQRLDTAERQVDQERMQPLQLGKQLVARAHGPILHHPSSRKPRRRPRSATLTGSRVGALLSCGSQRSVRDDG